ncbi:MAG: hypothetical protein K2I07_05375 [Lachnospiraceae bacterium]|nr:hypothetical protein [Lachnospiraceae bacterium]
MSRWILPDEPLFVKKFLKNKKVQGTILGLSAVSSAYLGFGFSTLAASHESEVLMLLHLLACAAAGAAYIGLCRNVSGQSGLRRQILVCSGVLWICSILFLVSNLVFLIRAGGLYEERYKVCSQFLVAAVATAACWYLFRIEKKAVRNGWELWKKNIVSHKFLFLLCLISLLLVYDPAMFQFKWDGWGYYMTSRQASVYSFSSMALYGHISLTVSAMIRFCTAVMGQNVAEGMILGNVIVFLTGICAYYGILRAVVPEKKEIFYAVCTAVYAWSPFMLGMVNYYSLDFYCICLFPVVLYFTVKKQWILQVVSGIFFCFIKEPAIVIYGFLCIGIVAVELCGKGTGRFADRVKGLFCRPQYYAMALAAVLWGGTILILGGWGGTGGFALDMKYVTEKLKVLYLFNFNWIFVLLALLLGVFLFARGGISRNGFWLFLSGKSRNVFWLFPLLSAQMGFTVFSCLFVTVNHARYSNIIPMCLYLTADVFVLELSDDIKMTRMRFLPVVPAVLSALLLTACYRTIDPVSKYAFDTFPIGDGTMISTGSVNTVPGDAMIYNKQTLWLEKALWEALAVVDFERDIVLFPAVDQCTYYFDGFREVEILQEGEYGEYVEYWNPKVSRREITASGDNIPFAVFMVPDAEAVECLIQEHPSGRYVYFYLDCAGAETAYGIKERHPVAEEEVYSYRGWKLYGLVFE